jgi:hypothetical protein
VREILKRLLLLLLAEALNEISRQLTDMEQAPGLRAKDFNGYTPDTGGM